MSEARHSELKAFDYEYSDAIGRVLYCNLQARSYYPSNWIELPDTNGMIFPKVSSNCLPIEVFLLQNSRQSEASLIMDDLRVYSTE